MWIGIQHNGSCKLHLRLHFRNRKCNVFHSMRGQYFIIGDNYYSFIPRYPFSNWLMFIHRADPRPAPSQWETLQSNTVSHRPPTNPETTLIHISNRKFRVVSVFNYIIKKKKRKKDSRIWWFQCVNSLYGQDSVVHHQRRKARCPPWQAVFKTAVNDQCHLLQLRSRFLVYRLLLAHMSE